MKPNYKKIFKDIIYYTKPVNTIACQNILKKTTLTMLDVITLNNLIFGASNQEPGKSNSKHRSYDKQSILQILDDQKKNKLNNTQVALKYKLSRMDILI